MKPLRFIGIVVLTLVAMLTEPTKSGAAVKPNIVIVLADDMGFSDIGCFGGEIHTPNLDKLAAHGLRFTQFYNTGRCCPTRASLLTGLYSHQTGVGHMVEDRGLDGYRGDLNERCVTIAQVLQSAGYATYMAGKWHVTKHAVPRPGQTDGRGEANWPLQRGFDRYYGVIEGAANYFNPVTLVRDNTPIHAEADNYYLTDAIAENAIEFVHGNRAGQPFFLYVAFTAPHWPLHARPEDIVRYQGRYDAGWDALRAERHQRQIAMGLLDPRWTLTERDTRAPAWTAAANKAWQSHRMSVYAAQVDRLDQNVGRIVAALEIQNALHNTLFIFLSDNGGCAEELGANSRGRIFSETTRDGRPVRRGNDPAVLPGDETTYQSYGLPWANASNTPFRLYKHFEHEGGIATPFIVHWPARIRQSGLRDQPAHLIDLMATCLDVAGVPYPHRFAGRDITPAEGTSLMPAFAGRQLHPRTLFWEHEGNRAVRDGRWKLVARGAQGPWELYDMNADRTETHNLASAFPERTTDLAAQWDDWAARTNAKPWPYDPPPKKQTDGTKQ